MNAMVTRCDEHISSLTDLTHANLKAYADKYGMDFLTLSEDFTEAPAGANGLGPIHYRIMGLRDLLTKYDRIICIDSDTLILPDCPNLFDVVPRGMIGTCLEDKGSRTLDRRERIRAAQNLFGDVNWGHEYINTGVFVVSTEHAPIFSSIDGQYWSGNGFDDVHLGYNIKKLGIPIHDLGYKFNHMTMFSEVWNDRPDRFDSHIIHYAGKGIFDLGVESRDEQIKKDLEHISCLPS